MKALAFLSLLLLGTGVVGQTKKTMVGTYQGTIEKQGSEEGCLYEIKFLDENGKSKIFTSLFHGEYSEGLEKLFCRKLTEQEIEKMNQDGQADKTVKTSLNKRFKLIYVDGQCSSIEAAEKIAPVDSSLILIEKTQLKMQKINVCPNCAEAGAKAFMNSLIIKIDKQLKTETKPKVISEITETKNFLKMALTESKYISYYFSNTRAMVLINKKSNGRFFAIQLRKTNGKWEGIGIDDSWWSCHEQTQEDKVDEKEMENCAKYIEKRLTIK